MKCTEMQYDPSSPVGPIRYIQLEALVTGDVICRAEYSAWPSISGSYPGILSEIGLLVLSGSTYPLTYYTCSPQKCKYPC